MPVNLPPHNVLSPFHLDTLTATVVRGGLVIGNSTPKWSLLTIGSSGKVLTSDGTDISWQTPATGLTIGTTTITSGTNGCVLYDNSGIVGEMTTTGSGTVLALATSPVLVTPTLGVATATSLNGNTFTAGTYTLTGVAGKTLTFSNSLTLAGTDATTMTFPTTSATIARTDAAQTFTGNQTITGGVLVIPNTAYLTPGIQVGATTTGVSGFNSGGTLVFVVGGAAAFGSQGHNILFDSTASINWTSSSTDITATADLKVFRDAANTLALRNGTNAQRFNLYNTFTSTSVFEDLSLYFSSNVAHIGTATTGATARVMQLDYGGTTTAAISIPITSGAVTFGGGITLSAADIATDTTTGTKIGTATTQKLGFYNATPVVQRADMSALTDSTTGTPSTTLNDVGVVFSESAINNNFASCLTQINKVRTALRDMGIMA